MGTNSDAHGLVRWILDAWDRSPALLRGAGLALSILFVGQLPPGLFVALALRYTPTLPWFLPATLAWLLVCWAYLDGRWPPAGTMVRRRQLLRARPLALKTWFATLLAGGLGLCGMLTAALLTTLVIRLPPAAYEVPVHLSSYPWWTAWATLFNLALVAGVIEEAAFRGYMLSVVQRQHGWVVGVISVALLFYVVHRTHAYAVWGFLPFFFAYSVFHGLLVYLTGSVLPSVVLHAVGDALILPIQYGVVANPLGDSVAVHVAVGGALGIASLLAVWQLAGHTGSSRHAELPPRAPTSRQLS